MARQSCNLRAEEVGGWARNMAVAAGGSCTCTWSAWTRLPGGGLQCCVLVYRSELPGILGIRGRRKSSCNELSRSAVRQNVRNEPSLRTMADPKAPITAPSAHFCNGNGLSIRTAIS